MMLLFVPWCHRWRSSGSGDGVKKEKNTETEIIFNDVIRKCHKCLKMNLVYFKLSQFCSIKAMSQSLFFEIEYWRRRDQSCLENRSGTNKIQSTFIVLLRVYLFNYFYLYEFAVTSFISSYRLASTMEVHY